MDRRDHRRRQLDLGDAVEMEASLVNGAVVHVAQRHPSAGQHPVQLDDPADQIRVGLLPERPWRAVFKPLENRLLHVLWPRLPSLPPSFRIGLQRTTRAGRGQTRFE